MSTVTCTGRVMRGLYVKDVPDPNCYCVPTDHVYPRSASVRTLRTGASRLFSDAAGSEEFCQTPRRVLVVPQTMKTELDLNTKKKRGCALSSGSVMDRIAFKFTLKMMKLVLTLKIMPTNHAEVTTVSVVPDCVANLVMISKS